MRIFYDHTGSIPNLDVLPVDKLFSLLGRLFPVRAVNDLSGRET
jgi:hypothetical protein